MAIGQLNRPRVRLGRRLGWESRCAMPAWRKRMHWIDASGWRPCAAMPTAMPLISVSASGVSITRRKPKRSCRPTVARNTPPLAPTSSPSTTTSGSSAMARCSARLIASTMQTGLRSVMGRLSQGSCPNQQFIALLPVALRQLGKQVVKGGARISLRQTAECLHGGIDPLAEVPLQLLLLLLVPQPLAMQKALQATDRLVLPGLAQLIGVAVAAGIIRGGVVAQPVGYALHQRRPLARPGALDGDTDAVIHCQHVIAIHLLTGNTRRQCLVRQRRRSGLQTARHRDRPLVVVHHEHYGQLPDTGQVQAFQKIALAGRAVATGGHRHPWLLADTEGRGHAAGMAGLSRNRYTDGEVFQRPGCGPGAAALITAPVRQDVLHRDPTLQLRGGIAVIGNQYIGLGHRPPQRSANGFLAEGRGIGADLASALQSDAFLIEGTDQGHLTMKVEQQLGIIDPAG